MKPSFYFNPITWSIRFTKQCLVEFNLEILGISKYTPESEMFLFGLSFALRQPLFFTLTIFGFQLFISMHNINIYWPDGTAYWRIWNKYEKDQ